MIVVRQVGIEEIESFAVLGRRMREESRIPFPPIDLDAIKESLSLMGQNYFAALAERDNSPVGFIAAQQKRGVFSTKCSVFHDIFFVAPEARGGRAALLLVRAMEAWARSIGAICAFIGVDTGLKVEITGRFYEKLDYRHMGYGYLKGA